MGLPLYLWTNEILKRIGDACDDFIVLDKETSMRTNLVWTRMPVKMEGKEGPGTLCIGQG